jgi:hypothetical protein
MRASTISIMLLTRALLLASGTWVGPRIILLTQGLVLLALPTPAAAKGLVVRTCPLWHAWHSASDALLLFEAVLLALRFVARLLDSLFHSLKLFHQGRVELALVQ